jgi:hypothetical protein
VVPAIHIVRVALKTPISLAILGMLRSDSSTNLVISLVSATSSNSFETVFPVSLACFDLCVLASVATEACSTDTGIHFARFTVTAEESRAFDLVSQRDFNLRFPLVKFDYAGDADDLPLEHGDPLVSRHF